VLCYTSALYSAARVVQHERRRQQPYISPALHCGPNVHVTVIWFGRVCAMCSACEFCLWQRDLCSEAMLCGSRMQKSPRPRWYHAVCGVTLHSYCFVNLASHCMQTSPGNNVYFACNSRPPAALRSNVGSVSPARPPLISTQVMLDERVRPASTYVPDKRIVSKGMRGRVVQGHRGGPTRTEHSYELMPNRKRPKKDSRRFKEIMWSPRVGVNLKSYPFVKGMPIDR
jgi:hypothetical protein